MNSHRHRVKQLLQLSHTGAVTAMAVHPDSLGARYAMLHRGYFGVDILVYTVIHIYIVISHIIYNIQICRSVYLHAQLYKYIPILQTNIYIYIYIIYKHTYTYLDILRRAHCDIIGMIIKAGLDP